LNTPYQEALGATLIDRTVREKIVLVAVALPDQSDDQVEASLDELELLVDTAGADVVARLVQRRDAPDHTWYIGKGKVEELKEVCLAVDADTVVFDNELAPAQQFNLEKLLGRTAIDRTAVILDIFGQNAHTLEGKAQVELALLRYRLPRLRRGKGANLSQQRGGVGARFGGGETKIEVDRRRIMRRITKLESDLKDLAATRDLQRKSRRRSGSPTWRSSATPTPASRRSSTASPTPVCCRRTGCSPRSTRPRVVWRSRAVSRCCSPTPSGSSATSRTGWSRRSRARSRSRRWPTTSSTSSTRAPPDPEGQIAAVRTVLAEIGATRSPS
jgi:hypothetical protein